MGENALLKDTSALQADNTPPLRLHSDLCSSKHRPRDVCIINHINNSQFNFMYHISSFKLCLLIVANTTSLITRRLPHRPMNRLITHSEDESNQSSCRSLLYSLLLLLFSAFLSSLQSLLLMLVFPFPSLSPFSSLLHTQKQWIMKIK